MIQQIMTTEGYVEEDLQEHLNKLERSITNQTPKEKKEQDFSLVDVDDDLLGTLFLF